MAQYNAGIFFEDRRYVSESHPGERKIGNDPNCVFNLLSQRVVNVNIHKAPTKNGQSFPLKQN